MNNITALPQTNLIESLAKSASLDPQQFKNTLKATVLPGNISDEQFTAFLMVAKKYDLNPITKEIYAFPAKGGGIQPIVSIDGWLNIINSHPQFDGMEFKDHIDNGILQAVTCKIYRKDRKHPTEVTEYMNECTRNTDVWRKWPSRMLRHKATIQCARYAFGFSGIYDPDEAERIEETKQDESHSVVIEPIQEEQFYNQDDFNKNLPTWLTVIESGRKTADELILMVESKNPLSEEQKAIIKGEVK